MSAVADGRKKVIDAVLRSAKLKNRDRTIEKIVRAVSRALPGPGGEAWSERIIKNDIAEMRKRGAPIVSKKFTDFYREKRPFYYYEYANSYYKWDAVATVPEHLYPLQVACAFLSPYQDMEPVKKLIAYTKKIERSVPEDAVLPDVPVYFSPLARNQVKPGVWDAILSAATHRRVLEITYKGWKGQSAKKPRRIAPYAIVQLEGEWYLYGTAQLQDDAPRQYKMSRILTAKETMLEFDLPESMEEMEEILSYSFGQFICTDDLEEMTVRFKKRIAMLALEREWQAQQNVTGPDENGDITITFPVSKAGPWPYYHAIRWILSWGSDIEVLEPQELKDLVRKEVEKMYGK